MFAVRIRPPLALLSVPAPALALALAFALFQPAPCSGSVGWTPDPPGTDALWSSGFGVPQFDGAVTIAARDGADLVVGGEFRVAGGVAANSIARWDGVHWFPLGTGLPVAPDAIVVRGDTVWVGWSERSETGWTGQVAFWEGGRWSAPIVAPRIRSMVIFRGRPTIAVLGASGYQVQSWDGSAWAPLGDSHSVDTVVSEALFTDGDSLYMGGQFRLDGTSASTPVLKVWDGTGWSVRASATGGPNQGYVLSIGSVAGRLMIGGVLPEIDGVPVTNIAYREGGLWHAMGNQLLPVVTQITDDGAGHPLVFGAFARSSMWGAWPGAARWDGAQWLLMPNDLYPSALGVVEVSGQLFAFGSFQQDGYRELHALARLDETSASAVGSAGAAVGGLGATQGGGSVNAIASFGGTTVVAGAIVTPGDSLYYDGGRGVMERDGDRWRSLTDGTYFSGRVLALHRFGDRLLAGGRFGMSLGTRATGGIAQWDGARWWPMGAVTGEVDAFAEYHGSLYIGGKFGIADGLLCSSIARWTGTRWLPVGPVVLDTGSAAPQIHAMTVWRDRLVVAGSFETRGNTPAQNIAAWDGSNWSELAGSPTGTVTALAATDSLLYAGVGPLTIDPIAPVPADQPLEAWDGTQWHAVAAPLNTGIRTLLSTPSGLFVGSDFQGPDGDLVGLARFDGSNWYSMGSGLKGPTGGPIGLGWDCSAQALALMPEGLWAGGSFSLAGGQPASRIARFEGMAPALPPPGSRLVSVAPSPTPGPFTLRFRIANSGRVRVHMFDIAGHEVATLHDAVHSSGPVVIGWDGHRAAGAVLRSGIYLMRIESAGESERTSRVAIVR